MGKYTLEISSKARKELQGHYRSGNKSVIRKIEQIFLELSNTPYKGTGNPEALKYELAGYWSLWSQMSHSLKLLRHPADHLKGLIAFVPVLVFFSGIHQGKVTGF